MGKTMKAFGEHFEDCGICERSKFGISWVVLSTPRHRIHTNKRNELLGNKTDEIWYLWGILWWWRAVGGNFGVSEKPETVGRKRSQVWIPGIGASGTPKREIWLFRAHPAHPKPSVGSGMLLEKQSLEQPGIKARRSQNLGKASDVGSDP